MKEDNNNASPKAVRNLMLFFLLVYVAEGFGQVSGMISQPLTFYLKTALGWQADRVTAYTAAFTLPWVIKPLYGILSDAVPLFGYRRRPYLFIANAMAVGAYIWLTGLRAPGDIYWALLMSAVGMAASSTLCGAVLVENGKTTGMTGKFVGQQWLWFAAAGIVTSLVGGWLAQNYAPGTALGIAAGLTAAAPVGVMLGCWFLVEEPKITRPVGSLTTLGWLKREWTASPAMLLFKLSPLGWLYYLTMKMVPPVVTYVVALWKESQLVFTFSTANADGRRKVFEIRIGWKAFIFPAIYLWRSHRTMLLVSVFIMLWYFSPGFGTPLYYHMVNDLHFSQKFIGTLGAISSVGAVLGSLLYMYVLDGRFSLKKLIYISIVLGASTEFSYLLLSNETTAIVLGSINAVAAQIVLLTTLTLAAKACPNGAEGTSYGILMSIFNLTNQASAISGGYLYTNYFHQHLSPLIILGGALTAACALIVWILPKSVLAAKSENDEQK